MGPIGSEGALVQAGQASGIVAAGALVVDVRHPDARRRDGLLPGAVQVAKAEVQDRFAPDSEGLLPGIGGLDRAILVVCSSERGSGPVVAKLGALGYTRVSHVRGGFPAWRAAGLPEASSADREGSE